MRKLINKLITTLIAPAILAMPLMATNEHLKCPIPIYDWSRGNQQFTHTFYSAAQSPDLNSNENFIFSPISLQVNLSMLAEIAQRDTKQEILMVAALPKLASARQRGAKNIILSLNGMMEEKQMQTTEETEVSKEAEMSKKIVPQLLMTNKIWFSWQTSYTYSTEMIFRNSYQSEIEVLNFKEEPETARQGINQWVAENTFYQIPELMPEGSITEDSRVVLANTLYMRSPWKKPFDPELTDEAPFFGLEKSLRPIPFMHQTDCFGFVSELDYDMIELPFDETTDYINHLSMIIILPKEGKNIQDIEANLATIVSTEALLAPLEPRMINLSLPRFQVSSTTNAKEVLEYMGLSLPFSQSAEFEVFSREQIAVTDIVHQAIFEVDELGGLGSAATGTTIGVTSIGEPALDVVVDRPFLFFIVERNKGIILFAGKINQPRDLYAP